ncbi:hypothetical protein GGI25_003376 [Coemansia spiralis]|uniref:Armadillo repeat-containing protein 8 n=2 Tax=Coemansia TaxID=4863 RepID=A0A9W8G795_9FUNG|nr:armadillo-type protein [Coemansia spiralis]KAJ1990915.1 hypothetical protein EDC05_003765 [Coemansia umbellata]KAJ2621694.1 hypothetical protein GGI26_003902 [Coemansia sp. RSA 1358]KAJ2676841.1 hypothetical protein GGI25_003376 [Coemansia spiralis]
MASIQQQPTQFVQQLQSPDPVVVYGALRMIKNAIIGSSAKKLLYFRLQIIPNVSSLLAMDDTDVQIRVQATTIISSLAHKGEEVAKQLLETGVMTPLINQIIPGTDFTLMEVSERALNALLSYTSTKMSIEEHASIIVPYLISIIAEAKDNSNVHEMHTHARIELAVLILGKLCATEARQYMIANTGIIDLLVPLLLCSYPRLQISTLQALSAMSYENMEISRALSLMQHNGRSFLNIVLDLARHRAPEIRLHASICLSNLSRMRVVNGSMKDIQMVAVPALVKLLKCSQASALEVVQALGYLCHEDAEIQVAAKNAGAIVELMSILTEIENQEDADFVDQAHNAQVEKATLLTLGTIVSAGEECRAKAVECQAFSHLVRAMNHPDNGIKSAACLCTQYIVRSVPICRTHVPESGILKPLLGLLRHKSTDVQITASAALINLLPDFSPVRTDALKEGVIDILVELIDSDVVMLRRNALWCIRNVLVGIEDEMRKDIMDKVKIERIYQLSLPGVDPVIREKAVGVLQNVTADSVLGTNIVFDTLGSERVMELLKQLLAPKLETPVYVHALYLINNIAVRSQPHCELIVKDRSLLQDVVGFISSSSSEIAIGALWCINSIVSHKCPTAPEQESDSIVSGGPYMYITELEELGVVTLLEDMLQDHNLCLAVQDRVKSCLDYFNDGI